MTLLRSLAALGFAALLCAGCATKPSAPVATQPAAPATPAPPGQSAADGPPEPAQIPANVASLPDPEPRDEPRSAYGNPPSYQVFGKTYYVLDRAEGFREKGIASWYGRKFHGRKTSSGEIYDMFKMTAAHKSLPLPSYVRVTNAANGRSIVVRVNDRGPFHKGRIIDLSYAAAAKLDLLHGTGLVEIEAITPGATPAPSRDHVATTAEGAQYLQVAAFVDPINAVSMRDQLDQLGLAKAEIRPGVLNGGPVHRVLLGPFSTAGELGSVRGELRDNGLDANPVVE